MTTFDELLPALTEIFQDRWTELQPFLPLLINRDLNGRIRLILDASHQLNLEAVSHPLLQLAADIQSRLAPHVGKADQILLFEDDFSQLMKGSCPFLLLDRDGQALPDVYVADRLAQEATWETISDPSDVSRAPRVVFYSIKGGVGRSTALAACAWSLAASGQRVLVLDLDLESPGLSSSLLPQSRQPAYGITDWLVEDLVGNGDAVMEQMHASVSTPQRGELIVVPSHGFDPGEYVSKLGRVWMPGFTPDGQRQTWSERLLRMIQQLEERHQPTIVLIDSRAGIDEVASACVTDLAAKRIYLFALDSLQTWLGYRILFEHWRVHGVASKIRKQLQVVGALLPTWGDQAFQQATAQLLENAYLNFSQSLYDEEVAGAALPLADEPFNFDLPDTDAPHSPLAIRWDQGFAAIGSLHERLAAAEPDQIKHVFGPLFVDLLAVCGAEP